MSDEQHEIEITLAYFEYWLRQSKFEYVNDLLRTFPIETTAPATSLAILSITFPAKVELPYRIPFLARVADRLVAAFGAERAERLLEHRR